MSDDWNPDIVTPDGEPVEIEPTQSPHPHRDKSVLESLVESGHSTREMADTLDVSESTIRRQLRNHGLPIHGHWSERWEMPMPGPRDGPDSDTTMDAEGDAMRTTHECPECGVEYLTEESQQTCMRSHAREEADRLQRLAADGHETINV